MTQPENKESVQQTILNLMDKRGELAKFLWERYPNVVATAINSLHHEQPYKEGHLRRDLQVILDYILDQLRELEKTVAELRNKSEN
ncbi:MAG TPA: hypothetical protein VFE96_05250 [Candidatus Bathyarchaeia archaeon]|jgi:hypothetical protein|nr:hypothetical protein [Candidatus Bathyarchaeia archaeon]